MCDTCMYVIVQLFTRFKYMYYTACTIKCVMKKKELTKKKRIRKEERDGGIGYGPWGWSPSRISQIAFFGQKIW